LGAKEAALRCDDSVQKVTSCNSRAPIATSGALRNPPEALLNPYCTQIDNLTFSAVSGGEPMELAVQIGRRGGADDC